MVLVKNMPRFLLKSMRSPGARFAFVDQACSKGITKMKLKLGKF